MSDTAKENAATKKALRQKLLGGGGKPQRKTVSLFGEDVDLVQPTFRAIMETKGMDSEAESASHMIIKFACVPGTDDRIFTTKDAQAILDWAFSADLVELNTAISELTGIDVQIAGATEDLETDPLLD